MKKEYLKILDDVDLKELEKFGLEFNNFGYYYKKIELPYGCQKIMIDCDDKEITIVGAGADLLCIIFDIIQAGLVEKVVEDERR